MRVKMFRYRGTSPIRKRPPPKDLPRTLGRGCAGGGGEGVPTAVARLHGCMGVDQRNYRFAPGLPPGRKGITLRRRALTLTLPSHLLVSGPSICAVVDLHSSAEGHPGGNPGANLKSMSHRCHPILVALVWELTKETIVLPLGCRQGGLREEWGPQITVRVLWYKLPSGI